MVRTIHHQVYTHLLSTRRLSEEEKECLTVEYPWSGVTIALSNIHDRLYSNFIKFRNIEWVR